VPVLTGEANEELFGKVMALTKAQGLEVSFEPRPYQDPSIKGQYFGKSIWVKPDEPRAQQLKTLLHEVAHYYSEGVFQIPRRDAETIAESAAFAIGAHFGFDTGVRSFPYVALWAQDKKVLELNLGSIRRVTTTIIEALETKMSSQQLLPRVGVMPKLPPEARGDIVFFEYIRDLVRLGEDISDEEARRIWEAWERARKQETKRRAVRSPHLLPATTGAGFFVGQSGKGALQ